MTSSSPLPLFISFVPSRQLQATTKVDTTIMGPKKKAKKKGGGADALLEERAGQVDEEGVTKKRLWHEFEIRI